MLLQHLRASRHLAQIVYKHDNMGRQALARVLLEFYAFCELSSSPSLPSDSADIETIRRSPVLRRYETFGCLFGGVLACFEVAKVIKDNSTNWLVLRLISSSACPTVAVSHPHPAGLVDGRLVGGYLTCVWRYIPVA